MVELFWNYYRLIYWHHQLVWNQYEDKKVILLRARDGEDLIYLENQYIYQIRLLK